MKTDGCGRCEANKDSEGEDREPGQTHGGVECGEEDVTRDGWEEGFIGTRDVPDTRRTWNSSAEPIERSD